MKRAIIVHCWEGYPKYCWYPQTKKELEKKGFQVEVPEMPETANPKLSGWLPKLKEIVQIPYKELTNFFIEPIEFEKIKKSSNNFCLINSDDDPYVPLKYADLLKNKLGAK